MAVDKMDQFKLVSENGLSFVSKAIEQLWENQTTDALKYSVINFYTGIELLLKARLMHEHWSLIVADPNKADIDHFLGGQAQTVGLMQAISRLKKVAKVSVPKNAVDSFDQLRKHRNQMVHFYHSIDVNDPNRKKEREAVILEQCRSWFYLRRLLGDEWADIFATCQKQLSDINILMKQHFQYLQTVYEQILPDLKVEEQKGAYLATCGTCNFQAQVIDEVGPQEHSCRVCLAKESFLIYSCENDECGKRTLLPMEMCEGWECEHCCVEISLDDVLVEFTIEGKSDYTNPTPMAICTECGQYPETAGTLDDGATAFCFNCFVWPEKIEYCEWCNDPFTGDAEHTYWSGCERCEGKAGWTRDD